MDWYFIMYFTNTKRITTGSNFLQFSYILNFHIKQKEKMAKIKWLTFLKKIIILLNQV